MDSIALMIWMWMSRTGIYCMDGALYQYLVVVYLVLTSLLCLHLFLFFVCRSVVPYYRIVRAVEECVEALAEKQKKD
jgi:hypothetical protein